MDYEKSLNVLGLKPRFNDVKLDDVDNNNKKRKKYSYNTNG